MSTERSDKKETLGLLTEIREACSVATSMEDTNLNAIIEEIDRLAKAILNILDN